MERLGRLREQLDLTRAQLGDEQAFMRLVERYHNRLLLYVRRLGADETDAEDIVQDVWVSAYRTLRRVYDAEAFPAWIYAVTRHHALSALRRRTRLPEPVGMSDGELENVANQDETPDLTTDEAAAVRRCLTRISVPHREVLVLRFFDGLSYDQMAAVLRCGVGTVRSRLHYAKRALRRAMESEGSHEQR